MSTQEFGAPSQELCTELALRREDIVAHLCGGAEEACGAAHLNLSSGPLLGRPKCEVSSTLAPFSVCNSVRTQSCVGMSFYIRATDANAA